MLDTSVSTALFAAGAILLGLSPILLVEESYLSATSLRCAGGKSDGNFEDKQCVRVGHQEEVTMDKEHLKGAADKAKGAVKEAAGKMTGDKRLEVEGKMDKAKGEARQALGDVKDAIKHANDD
jgi:uncharacterized protein YjbJ (UPF0337 family)